VVVEALNGDVGEFRALWLKARDDADGIEATMPEPDRSRYQADEGTTVNSMQAEATDRQPLPNGSGMQQSEASQLDSQAIISDYPKRWICKPRIKHSTDGCRDRDYRPGHPECCPVKSRSAPEPRSTIQRSE
jgi:hypothetical protein